MGAQAPSSGGSRVGQYWIFRGPSRSSLRPAVTQAKRDTLGQVPFVTEHRFLEDGFINAVRRRSFRQ